MDHDEESYYEQWIQRDNPKAQLFLGGLMAYLMFVSEDTPL